MRSFFLFVVSLWLSLEAVGFASTFLLPHLYNDPDITLADLYKPNAQQRFDDFMLTRFSPRLGWVPPMNNHRREKDCKGEMKDYTHDDLRARTYKNYDRAQVKVIIAGDSFSWGDELNDDETVAAQIYTSSGIMGANIAFRGYDPTQAFLRAKDEMHNYPNAKVVVLGIMYENIRRLENGYRPAYQFSDAIIYGFKPYMKEGQLQPRENNYKTLDEYKEVSRVALTHDYWSRPAPRFPYSIAFVKGLMSHDFRQRVSNKLMGLPREFQYDYDDKERGENLLALVNLFDQWAKDQHVKPIVMFIPANRNDSVSPLSWIEAYSAQLPPDLIIKNFDSSQIDFKRYTIGDQCHPSAYGAGEIARQYIPLLKDALQ